MKKSPQYELGMIYGYPKCCLEAFQDNAQRYPNKFDGTGYIPCKRHSKMTVLETLTEIEEGRKSPYKFPFDGDLSFNLRMVEEELDAELLMALEELHNLDIKTIATKEPNRLGTFDPVKVKSNAVYGECFSFLSEVTLLDRARLKTLSLTLSNRYAKLSKRTDVSVMAFCINYLNNNERYFY